MLEMFREGGGGMFVVLALGIVAIGVGIAVLNGNERLREAAFGLVLATVLSGGAFMVYTRSRVEDAIENVDPAYREQLRERGYTEASRPLQLGVGLAAIAGAVVGVAESRRKRS